MLNLGGLRRLVLVEQIRFQDVADRLRVPDCLLVVQAAQLLVPGPSGRLARPDTARTQLRKRVKQDDRGRLGVAAARERAVEQRGHHSVELGAETLHRPRGHDEGGGVAGSAGARADPPGVVDDGFREEPTDRFAVGVGEIVGVLAAPEAVGSRGAALGRKQDRCGHGCSFSLPRRLSSVFEYVDQRGGRRTVSGVNNSPGVGKRHRWGRGRASSHHGDEYSPPQHPRRSAPEGVAFRRGGGHEC